MSKIRVLVVDDAVVVRRMVTDVLATDPEIEVAGTAANGRIALAKIPQINPDLVTLDIEMPEMDGLESLAVIRKTYPRLPVIMFSTLTQRGATATLDALALGATDYVTKPANVGSVQAAIHRISQDLIPKIKQLCRRMPTPMERQKARATSSASGLAAGLTAKTLPRACHIDIVTIGVSTGGPNALSELLPALPAGFPVPIVIVQHMPPLFTKLLAERLASRSAIEVSEATAGETLKPGKAWLAPGDYHMALERDARGTRVRLHQAAPENSCRPAADVLFRSVAETFGASALAVVLTGMGQDGLRGCEQIKEAGGQVLVQDEASSVVWGMPGYVARAGLADRVLPLDQLGGEIMRRANHNRTAVML